MYNIFKTFMKHRITTDKSFNDTSEIPQFCIGSNLVSLFVIECLQTSITAA